MTSGDQGREHPVESPASASVPPVPPVPPPDGAPTEAPPGEAPPGEATKGAHSRHNGKKRLSFLQELPFLIVAALVLAIIIKAFVVQAFYIPSGSMEKTLHGCPGCSGDRVMVNKLVYDVRGIHRGDIVVFNGKDNYQSESLPQQPASNPIVGGFRKFADWIGLAPEGTDYIKRVIGLPHDHLHCCDAQGRVTVNGKALNEPYVFQNDHEPFDVVVPAKHIFVMGDHRGDSYDSRKVGAVPEDDVIGRAFAIIWPPSRWRWLSQPSTFHGIPAHAADATPLAGSLVLVGGGRSLWRRRRRRRSGEGRRPGGRARLNR